MTSRPSRQQEEILKLHRGQDWVCATAYAFIRDHRKRISELNNGYLKERGYKFVGEKCDGRCGKTHSSALFMRKVVRLDAPESQYTPHRDDLVRSAQLVALFDQNASTQQIMSVL